MGYRERLLDLGGPGSGNFGHAGRPGEVGGSAAVDEAGGGDTPRAFAGNEGYDWHERPAMHDYVQNLPYKEANAISNYASFGYGDVNRTLRGTPPTKEIVVRAPTPEELARYRETDEPRMPVEDGYLATGFATDPDTGKSLLTSVKARVPDEARIAEMRELAATVNKAIAEHGYPLEEAVVVNRAAYRPGLSYDDLKAMEGTTIEEPGFSSTMLGNPSNRLDGYVEAGKAESLYKRYAEFDANAIYAHQDEVGAAMRIAIILPKGTKVAPVEAIRRTDYEFPRVQDPEVFNHPEWLRNADGSPNSLKPEDFTKRDYDATPTVKTDDLRDKTKRTEAEILLGSGAQFRVRKVQRGEKRLVSADDKMHPIDVIDVTLEYVGGGSSAPAPAATVLRQTVPAFHLGDDIINLPSVQDVSFPTLIGALPSKPKAKKKRKKPVLYQGVKLSRLPMQFEVQILSLAEIPPRLDAAVLALTADPTRLRATVETMAAYGAAEVCRELVRQGADPALTRRPAPPVATALCLARIEQDWAHDRSEVQAWADRRLSRTRLRGEARARVEAHLLSQRAPALAKRHAATAVNEAFALGRRVAIATLRRPRIDLAYRDSEGRFISESDAIAEGHVDIDAVVMTAVMDTNTCEECAEVDGEVMEFGDDRQEELHPPYINCAGGDRCRCIQIALLSNGNEINVDEIDPDTLDDDD